MSPRCKILEEYLTTSKGLKLHYMIITGTTNLTSFSINAESVYPCDHPTRHYSEKIKLTNWFHPDARFGLGGQMGNTPWEKTNSLILRQFWRAMHPRHPSQALKVSKKAPNTQNTHGATNLSPRGKTLPKPIPKPRRQENQFTPLSTLYLPYLSWQSTQAERTSNFGCQKNLPKCNPVAKIPRASQPNFSNLQPSSRNQIIWFTSPEP